MKSLLLFKKFRSVLISKKKKNDFDLSKYQICFVGCRKMWLLEIENSDMCLSHEIKSFDLKNIRSVFLRTKKWF